jgi:hypothetical protein
MIGKIQCPRQQEEKRTCPRQGESTVNVDGKVLHVSDRAVDSDAFNVTYVSSHHAIVQTEQFVFTFDNSDMFINQAVRPRVALSEITAHGLFGQTHKAALYPSALKYIAGEVDDYLINESGLFGVDFVYNQFKL